MALTEINKVDQIEIIGDHTIQVRTATIIEKDGTEISRTFHRHVIEPGMDVSNEDPKVQSVVNALFTEEVIAAYQAGIQQDSIV
jgi:hypothetical protein